MHNWIENLRGKSEGYRRGVAFTVSLAVTLVIAGVWATTTIPSLTSGLPVLANKAKEVQGPVATFRRNVAQSFDSVKIQWSTFGKYFRQVDYTAEPTLQVVTSEKEKNEVQPRDLKTSDNQFKDQNRPTNKAGSVIY